MGIVIISMRLIFKAFFDFSQTISYTVCIHLKGQYL